MKSKSSYIMAGIVALAVVGWMFSDDLLQKYGALYGTVAVTGPMHRDNP